MAVAVCAKGDSKRFLVGVITSVYSTRLEVHYYSSFEGDEFGRYQKVVDPASQLKGKPWRGEFETKDVVVYFDDFDSNGKIPAPAADQIRNALNELSD
jgi:hypothetical protein